MINNGSSMGVSIVMEDTQKLDGWYSDLNGSSMIWYLVVS